MLAKLLDWVTGREPVAAATGLAGLVTATLGVAAAFGLGISPEQIAAVGALAAALAGFVARGAVTPVAGPRERQEGPRGEYAGGTFEQGGVPLALIILVALGVAVVAGLGFCGDALFEDEDEVNDLGAPALILDHDGGDPCWDYGDCGGGYDERNGGSGDGRGGDGRFGGGRSGDYDGGPGDDCRNACGNTIIVPDPRGGR
jgi:hypothetical protein